MRVRKKRALALPLGGAPDQRLDRRRDALDDDADALGIGVDAVGLVQLRPGGDPVEEERVEEGAVLRGELRIDRVEGGAVVLAEIGRSAHAGKQHGQLPPGEAGEDLIERFAGDPGVDATEGVVGAKLDDHRIGVVGEGPVETGEAVARRVARHAGVDDGDVVTARP